MLYFYLLMCVLGTLLPYGAFLPWLVQNGLDIPLLVAEASQNPIAAFAWLDVIVSALVLLAFIWYEGRRLNIKNLWLPTAATLSVGVSLGLPLFLLMRERLLRQATSD